MFLGTSITGVAKRTKGVQLLFFFFTSASVIIFLEASFLLAVSSGNLSRSNQVVSSGRPLGQGRVLGRIYSLSSSASSVKTVEFKQTIIGADARPLIIKNYLSRYNSPLFPYWRFIFDTSIKYGLDYRLLVAIAQQESNLCKKIPEDSYNCWGWGIHSRGTFKCNSFSQCIEIVAKGIKKDYIDKGYKTPEQIMKKYTPLSNGSWALGVRQFMEEMENDYGEE
jgi:hypothetical protein